MGLKVYTGYNDSTDGFLVITEKNPATLAASMGLHYHTFQGHDQTHHVFSEEAVLSDGDKEDVINGNSPGSITDVYFADYEVDKNLSGAVCW